MIDKIKLKLIRIRWAKKNKHNYTVPINQFNTQLVSVGKKTYGGLYVLTFNNESKLKIGAYCSIAPNVAFMLSADHYIHNISTYPFMAKIFGEKYEGISKGNIIVDDDVWIGYGAIIMSGVHIGQGAVIAAGAVVTKDIPPYAIVGGVPAKVIKYRFELETREKLLNIDFNKFNDEMIGKYKHELYKPLKDVEQLQWLPQIGQVSKYENIEKHNLL